MRLRSVRPRFLGNVDRRSRLAVTLAATLAVMPLVAIDENPAKAADTIECGATASVFLASSDGTLHLFPLNNPGSSTSTWGTKKAIGSGWDNIGRVLGGPDGRLYGINSGGMYRYRWLGTQWEAINGSTSQHISTDFVSYATAEYRNKITVDERGDFYAIDSAGKLRMYRYDEASKTWVINGRVLDSGWGKYDLIVAAGLGVIYSRAAADGKLYRHRFESTSQRWIVRDQVVSSSDWRAFSKGMFSVGGDVLFGIEGDGDLFQYRYREDDNSWPIPRRLIGSIWHTYPNVTATTNTCRLNVSYVPAQPAAPLREFTPTQAMQASSNMIEYAYTDNIGRLLHARQDPDNFSSAQWTTISGSDAFSGEPTLTQNASGLVQVFGRNINSDVWSRTQTAAGSSDWNAWADLAGRMASAPAVVKLSDGTQVAFALDADGTVWSRPQDGTAGELMAWRSLGGSGLSGTPTAVAVDDAAAVVFALDANGTVQTARYQNGVLSAWTSLGGSGFTGRISAVVMPGYSIRVFASDATGHVVTQRDNAGVFPGTWSVVGGDFPVALAGSPSALLSPVTGRVGVFARGGDGHIYYAGETAQGSGVWNNWILAENGGFETYATDPIAFTFTNSAGPLVAYVVRTSDSEHRVWTVDENGPTAAGGNVAAGTSESPVFVRHDLPKPPNP